MNILYLHGLKSKLNSEKRKILEQYGNVFAPDIDYQEKYIQPVTILQNYPETEFNVVIGSSMGALNAYIISNWIGRLLFCLIRHCSGIRRNLCFLKKNI